MKRLKPILSGPGDELECVMCDVIKIRLKGREERRSGKGNPYTRDGFRRTFMTSSMTLSNASVRANKTGINCLIIQYSWKIVFNCLFN